MPVAAVSQVETDRIAGQKPAHDRCDRSIARAQEQVDMVGHQGPGVTGRSRFQQQSRKPVDKILPVVIIFEDHLTFDPSDNDVMQGAGGAMERYGAFGLFTVFSSSIQQRNNVIY